MTPATSVRTLPTASPGQRLARLSRSFLPPPRAADKLQEAPAAPAETEPQKGAREEETNVRAKHSNGKTRKEKLFSGKVCEISGFGARTQLVAGEVTGSLELPEGHPAPGSRPGSQPGAVGTRSLSERAVELSKPTISSRLNDLF